MVAILPQLAHVVGQDQTSRGRRLHFVALLGQSGHMELKAPEVAVGEADELLRLDVEASEDVLAVAFKTDTRFVDRWEGTRK